MRWRARFYAASRLTNLPRAIAGPQSPVLLRRVIPRQEVASPLTLFDAFDTPVSPRETDHSLRSMLRRARREYFARFMPVWAGILTLGTLCLGLPGFVLFIQAIAPELLIEEQAAGIPWATAASLALNINPFQPGFASVVAWSAPVTDWLHPTLDRFGLESFFTGCVCVLALAAIIRTAGGRQWYQTVYDDIPGRRLLLTLLLAVLLPVLAYALLTLIGVMEMATARAPRVASGLVWLVAVLALTFAVFLVFLTFTVRRPAPGALLAGAAVAGFGLGGFVALANQIFVSEADADLWSTVAAVLALFLGWSLFLAGSQLAVSVARVRDPIGSFLHAGRGEQLDFALRLVRDLENQTRIQRWSDVEALRRSLTAHPAMVSYVLDRLRRSGLVEFDEMGRRPPQRWAIRDDLEALSLHDLSRAMGTHLEPSPGLHGQPAEQAIEALAAREHLDQSQDLLSLFRESDDAALAPGSPMLTVADVRFGLADIDAVAGAPVFHPDAELIDRAQGDNGGPVDTEPGYIFVDTVLLDSGGLNASAAGTALDLTQDMRLRDDYAMRAQTQIAIAEGTDSQAGQAERESAESPIILGQVSPLAAVQREIDNLLDVQSDAADPPATLYIAPYRSWRSDLAVSRARAGVVAEPDTAMPTDHQATTFRTVPNPTFVDPVASWRGFRIPIQRPHVSADLFVAAKAHHSLAPSAETNLSAPIPATVTPLYRVTFGAT